MAITYLKKSPKTSSTDDNKTTGIVQDLLKNIEKLDKEDMKKDGHLYKHFIFCDIKSVSYTHLRAHET